MEQSENLPGTPPFNYIKAYRVGHTEISVGEPQNRVQLWELA